MINAIYVRRSVGNLNKKIHCISYIVYWIRILPSLILVLKELQKVFRWCRPFMSKYCIVIVTVFMKYRFKKMYVLRNHVYSYAQVFVYECVFMLNPAHVWLWFQAHVADCLCQRVSQRKTSSLVLEKRCNTQWVRRLEGWPARLVGGEWPRVRFCIRDRRSMPPAWRRRSLSVVWSITKCT